ncbi:hypothetical protein RRH01S_16_00190 [Rhizobium rhizogenes NBRC 13257]|uniref:Uncharacterized protein n=1 Tax=Rhizobium rhizogenes NBRC 13257 TaxID=1220581 RepID=A0AA87U797_RHIRH|nr:hypothetical protein RRH01S_16_00190 [Rhizobium rhizogenes NBRC 13257]
MAKERFGDILPQLQPFQYMAAYRSRFAISYHCEGSPEENPTAIPINQGSENVCIGFNIVVEPISANRLPPLYRTDQFRGCRFFKPVGDLGYDTVHASKSKKVVGMSVYIAGAWWLIGATW